MKERITRIIAGVIVGVAVLCGIIWLLSKTLGNGFERAYAGRTTQDWAQQLDGHDPGASNAAFTVVTSQVVPQIEDAMLNDTHDSPIRVSLVNLLNCLPGVQVYYFEAGQRRSVAAGNLGFLGL